MKTIHALRIALGCLIGCQPMLSGATSFSDQKTRIHVIESNETIAFNADSILNKALVTDDYIRLIKHPDYWNNTTVGGKSRPSNIWTRGVFYEGHMALYNIHNDTTLYNYAFNWAKSHNWEMAYSKNTTTDADNQCCGQTYLELYKLDPKNASIKTIKSCLDYCIHTHNNRYWTWIDAIQMSMPAYALLGQVTGDTTYFNYMYRSYRYSRDTLDNTGLFNLADGFWWRDKNFNTPYVNSNGKPVYWSRGNGWVYAALTRVLNTISQTEPHYQTYLNDYLTMSASLVACQRADGFWNPSLADSMEYGGKETSGTSLFVYGIAWGLNKGLLDRASYLSSVKKGWTAISQDAIHGNGFLGWMQGTGDDPSDSQPLSYDKVPDFEDYGAGCVLLAAAESYKLARTLEQEDSVRNAIDQNGMGQLKLLTLNGRIQLCQAGIASVSIFDAAGICRYQERLTGDRVHTIETANWPSGVYLVRIESNKQITVLKFIN
ncbi:MAG: glycoside hydrolase family 88 protein [Bacteroidota bacterium]|nr:glycoside hydrolase family 88 protein [Bacteroidota bacterium]